MGNPLNHKDVESLKMGSTEGVLAFRVSMVGMSRMQPGHGLLAHLVDLGHSTQQANTCSDFASHTREGRGVLGYGGHRKPGEKLPKGIKMHM